MWTRRQVLGRAGQVAAGLAVAPAVRGVGAQASADAAPPPATPALGSKAAGCSRLYGAAVDTGLLRRDPLYRAVLVRQCRIVVAENAMKWQALRPAPGVFHWDEADALMQFATEHGMEVRGHNLCWHEALPAWFAQTATPANAQALLREHIAAVAGRWRGRIRAWDVVNEAVEPEDGQPGGLRNSPWLRLAGPGYVEAAFRAARAADPGALLTYNDYGIEYDTPTQATKRAAVLALVRGLHGAGLVDAVGVQSHLTAHAPNALGPGLQQFADVLHGMGLKVFVTELDVNDDHVDADDPAVRDAAVAEVYGSYVAAMVAHPAVADVLTWGIADNHTWLNSAKDHKARHPGRAVRPLPLDAEYRPKPAFAALGQALGSQPATP